MDKIKRYLDMLMELPQITQAEHCRSETSSVTTSWGSEPWTPAQIVRDCLQNYRDACVSAKIDINNVKIDIKGDTISVYAPTEYSLQKLYFIGSQKSEEENMIGINGEGAKKAFSDLTRHGIFDPINISGSEALIVGVGPEVKGTDLRPLVYHYFKINQVKGSYLILNRVMKKDFKTEFKFGMNNFFYSSNPLVGTLLHDYNGIYCYKSNSKDGHGFYRGLKRVDIKGIPIIINIEKPYAALEKKIKSDRDRNAFDQKLQSTFFGIFARSGFYYRAMEGNAAIKHILQSSKSIWQKGHPLLSSIATNTYGSLKDDKSLKELFGKEYISESKWSYSRDISYSDWFSIKTQNYIRNRDTKEKKKKKIMLPSYFNNFGVLSSLESFIRNKTNTEKRIKDKKTKELTSKEQKAINFCFEAAKGVSPSFAKLFNKEEEEDENLYNVKFKKIFCKELLGELKNNSDYNSKTIYLHKDLFKASFGKMFSTFLHELSHATGNIDGSREFSDCLTFLIQKCIDNSTTIEKYSSQWSNFKN